MIFLLWVRQTQNPLAAGLLLSPRYALGDVGFLQGFQILFEPWQQVSNHYTIALANAAAPSKPNRLEGKPQQQQRDLTSSDKRGVREWTMEELDRRIAELTTPVEGGKAPAGRNRQMRKIFLSKRRGRSGNERASGMNQILRSTCTLSLH